MLTQFACWSFRGHLYIILYEIYKFIYHVIIMIFVDGIENVTNKKGEVKKKKKKKKKDMLTRVKSAGAS